jgi:hypothetical protein
MATSAKWTYINVWNGRADTDDVRPADDYEVSDPKWGPDYEVLVKTSLLLIVTWLKGPSLHIFIHKDLIDA